MILPPGYLFIPTDEVLIQEYLERKANDEPLPSDAVFEREIYGAGNKAPWQIFDENDPWQENTVYVITKLFKASKGRIARTAGCGSWHGEIGPKPIFDDMRRKIGFRRMLRFRITNESELMDEGVRNIRWIMHEFSLSSGKGEYVLCKIRKDESKPTKKSLEEVENLEAANSSDADVMIVKPGKRVREEFEREQKTEAPETEFVPHAEVLYDLDAELQEVLDSILESDLDHLKEVENLEAANTSHDADVMIAKPAKRVREEFEREQKTEAPETEFVPHAKVLYDIEAELHEELASILETEQQPSIDHLDAVYPQNLSWLPSTPISSGHTWFGF